MNHSGVWKGKTASKCYIKTGGELSYRHNPKASKPVKHVTYYSSPVQPVQRYWVASPRSCLIQDWQENDIPCLEADLTGISGGVSFHPTKPEHWEVILCLVSLSCCQSISSGFLLPVTPVLTQPKVASVPPLCADGHSKSLSSPSSRLFCSCLKCEAHKRVVSDY